MFQQQEGCLGVSFLVSGDEHLVVTLWRSPEDVDRLARSSSYTTTAAALSATGVLRGDQLVEVFEVEVESELSAILH